MRKIKLDFFCSLAVLAFLVYLQAIGAKSNLRPDQQNNVSDALKVVSVAPFIAAIFHLQKALSSPISRIRYALGGLDHQRYLKKLSNSRGDWPNLVGLV